MSAIQVTINGIPDQVVTAYMKSLPVLSAGLDQQSSSTLNNIVVEDFTDGGNIKIGDSAMGNAVGIPITNTAIGYQSLSQANGNTDNIAIGTQSLNSATTGSTNIGIGKSALGGLTTQTNTIGIGNNTQSSASNGIILGNNAILTNNNSGILKFNSTTNNSAYPASGEFWFGDSSTGWITVRTGNLYVDNLNVSGSLIMNMITLNQLQITSDNGYVDVLLRNSTYTNSLNKIDEIRNTATFRNKYGPIAFIADVSGVLSSANDPILGEKILFGYQQGTRAFEINNYGAISLNSINSGNSLPSLTSNYGTIGHVIMSQGSINPPEWKLPTDLSGVITTYNRNINGITYVRDVSGNLDSSSNFIYDGSGIQITGTKNSNLYGLQIQNTNSGTSAVTNLNIKNDTNTSTIELKSTLYTAGTTIDTKPHLLSIKNNATVNGSISLNSGDRTLISYSSNTKAIEVNSSGAMSFDTSNNSGTWVSNYGTSGQMLYSQGSSAPPKWDGATLTCNTQANNYLVSCSAVNNVLDGNSDLMWDGNKITMTSTTSGATIIGNANTNCAGASVCIGQDSGKLTGMSGTYNCIVGYYTGRAITSGNGNALFGCNNSQVLSTGIQNTMIGISSGDLQTTQSNNTVCGYYSNCRDSTTTYSNCSVLGANIRNGIITASNQVQLGDSATSTYIYGTIQTRSDSRDKADITTITDNEGLNLINKLNPVKYKYDYREDYTKSVVDANMNETITTYPKDGRFKRNRWHMGLVGQEIETLIKNGDIDDFGLLQNHKINGGGDRITLGYEELIASLIKSVQQLSNKVDNLQSQLNELNKTT